MLSGGIEGAILVLAAQYWGKGDLERLRKIISMGLHLSIIFGLATALICFIFPEHIIRLFSTNEKVAESGAEYLKIVCLSYVFFCTTQTLIAAMRSVETAGIGMVVSLISLFANIIYSKLRPDFWEFRLSCSWCERRSNRNHRFKNHRDRGHCGICFQSGQETPVYVPWHIFIRARTFRRSSQKWTSDHRRQYCLERKPYGQYCNSRKIFRECHNRRQHCKYIKFSGFCYH